MSFALAVEARDQGYHLESHETVSSTNAIAIERALDGDPGRLWVVSTRQESGRGRRGRIWETPRGNLAATLLLSEVADLKLASTLGFVAGLSLGEALGQVAPGRGVALAADGGGSGTTRFELKWPNDVLADGAKLAGILLESTMLARGGFALAIGIGVNVVAHPAGLPYPATSLSALGANCTAEDLFLALSAAWCRNYAIWDAGQGLDAIRHLWLEHAAGLGAEVAIRVDGTVRRGVFETIDEDCRFLIRDRAGTVFRIAAGDVHFGAVASERMEI